MQISVCELRRTSQLYHSVRWWCKNWKAGKEIVHRWWCYAVVMLDEKTRQKKNKRHQTTSMPSQTNRINGMSTSMQWESGRAFLGLCSFFFFFSKAFSLSRRQLQWASRTVSSNSWEMKGACALEKPISSKACACCSSGEGDVITEMSPVWWFTVGGRGDTVPQKAHKELCWQRLKELVHK